jgi:hypothetical protein
MVSRKIIIAVIAIVISLFILSNYSVSSSYNNNNMVVQDYKVSFISNSTINYTLSFNGNLYKQIGNVSFELANGSYKFSYSGNGFQSSLISFTVNGANVNNYLYFSHTIENSNYTVQFIEQGLSQGIEWHIFLNNTLYGSNTSIIVVKMPHYYFNESYTILNVSGYNSVMSGNLTLNSNNTVFVYFAQSNNGIIYYIPFIVIGFILATLFIVLIIREI